MAAEHLKHNALESFNLAAGIAADEPFAVIEARRQGEEIRLKENDHHAAMQSDDESFSYSRRLPFKRDDPEKERKRRDDVNRFLRQFQEWHETLRRELDERIGQLDQRLDRLSELEDLVSSGALDTANQEHRKLIEDAGLNAEELAANPQDVIDQHRTQYWRQRDELEVLGDEIDRAAQSASSEAEMQAVMDKYTAKTKQAITAINEQNRLAPEEDTPEAESLAAPDTAQELNAFLSGP